MNYANEPSWTAQLWPNEAMAMTQPIPANRQQRQLRHFVITTWLLFGTQTVRRRPSSDCFISKQKNSYYGQITRNTARMELGFRHWRKYSWLNGVSLVICYICDSGTYNMLTGCDVLSYNNYRGVKINLLYNRLLNPLHNRLNNQLDVCLHDAVGCPTDCTACPRKNGPLNIMV